MLTFPALACFRHFFLPFFLFLLLLVPLPLVDVAFPASFAIAAALLAFAAVAVDDGTCGVLVFSATTFLGGSGLTIGRFCCLARNSFTNISKRFKIMLELVLYLRH